MDPITSPYAPGAGTRPPELTGRESLRRTMQISIARIRNGLNAKGMIWSPNHGETAFTVPLFDEFMRRIMPGNEWRSK
jgi:hypothetical protein